MLWTSIVVAVFANGCLGLDNNGLQAHGRELSQFNFFGNNAFSNNPFAGNIRNAVQRPGSIFGSAPNPSLSGRFTDFFTPRPGPFIPGPSSPPVVTPPTAPTPTVNTTLPTIPTPSPINAVDSVRDRILDVNNQPPPEVVSSGELLAQPGAQVADRLGQLSAGGNQQSVANAFADSIVQAFAADGKAAVLSISDTIVAAGTQGGAAAQAVSLSLAIAFEKDCIAVAFAFAAALAVAPGAATAIRTQTETKIFTLALGNNAEAVAFADAVAEAENQSNGDSQQAANAAATTGALASCN